MDRRFENALDMESDGFPLRNKKRNFDRGQIPVFKIPLPLQMVGMARFELATFCPPDKRANQAALHPDRIGYNVTPISEKSSRFQHFFSRLLMDMFRVSGIG